MSDAIRVCRRDALGDGVRVVPLSKDERGRPREALVLLDEEGTLRAYLNRCEHLPIPLDAGSREFLSADRRYLVCGTHGALYRLGDGFCVEGPCAGRSLLALPVRVDEGWVEIEV
ncbi:MAG TPA: Rieske 2Fe-2S domain-containing protein [Sandaracinaceae bacterium LLY-WYZ-13_1]|nr:Rieske 2Fe-2S domain-containing protein [Sandaracinaceae bacterium LLY-WYZ-13_1]